MATQVTKVERRGDELRITGTVDGVEVTASGWNSALRGTRAEKVAYAKVQLEATAPPQFTDLGLSG